MCAKEAKRKLKEEKKRQADERARARAAAWNTKKAKEREEAYYASLRTPPPPNDGEGEWEPDFPLARAAEFEKELEQPAHVHCGRIEAKRAVRAVKTAKTKAGVAKAKGKRATSGKKTNAAEAAKVTINEPESTADEPADEPEAAKTDAQIDADLEQFLAAYLGSTVDSSNDPDLTTIDLETGATIQPAPPVQNVAPAYVSIGGVWYVRVDAIPQPQQAEQAEQAAQAAQPAQAAQAAQAAIQRKLRKPGSGRPLGSKDKQKRWSKKNPKPAGSP